MPARSDNHPSLSATVAASWSVTVFIAVFGLIGTFFAVTWNQNRLADAKKDIGIERLSRLKNALANSLEARLSTLMALDAYVHSYKKFC